MYLNVPNTPSAPSSPWTYFRKETRGKVQPSPRNTSYEEQMQQVKAILISEKLINEQRLDEEVSWFYKDMGIHAYYFETSTAEEVAQDIGALYAAKSIAQVTGGELELKLQHQTRKGRHIFVARSSPGSRTSPCTHIEHMIEQKFLGQAKAPSNAAGGFLRRSMSETAPNRYQVQTYRSEGTVAPDSNVHLRFYFVSPPSFHENSIGVSSLSVTEQDTDIEKYADKDFIKNLDPKLRKEYQGIMDKTVGRMGRPSIRLLETGNNDEVLLLVGYHHSTTHSFFSGLTDLYHQYGLYCPRKYIDQFSNGITIFTIHLQTMKGLEALTEVRRKQFVSDVNLIYILPRTALTPLFREGQLTAPEYAYAYAVWKFAFHFLARQAAEFADLAFAIKSNPTAAALLEQIKRVIRKEAYTEGRIMEAICDYPNLVKELYNNFAQEHQKDYKGTHTDEDFLSKIQKIVPGELDRQIFKSFLTFNKHLLKTNFYKPTKVALSFRLNANFLSKEDYPQTPYGLFFIVGPEFRGFHIRMRDIARGGIRMIRSHNMEAFIQNVTTVFQENYNLASTQDRKNKDIAEGGSKGTILLSLDQQDKPFEAFMKYTDSLMDLLKPDDYIVDKVGQQEILFLGPDEGTANYMDWASQHAKTRGYQFWKAFTTGKSTDIGGIPHDLYGMTTRSVHQYVVGALAKLGWPEDQCTKFQTGGPDGDLGSNEIKISKDKTIGIVDGSGVLYDPKGLDRNQLADLAKRRVMGREFDTSKLSSQGFFIDINDVDIKLPDGQVIPNGMDFRNNFHTNPLAGADIFVPCGGRPEAVNMTNVHKLWDETGKPRFKVVIEGANLFFSQEARLVLEKKGVVIYKDASANKGGVTSSSLEVLAALSLNDEEFAVHMNGNADFYKTYVVEVQNFIESNARMEFECIWNENIKNGTSRCLLSDIISNKINDLSSSISNSELWQNDALKRRILAQAFPKTLQKLVGLDKMIERVPENYLRAVFGTFLASRYVYTIGLSSTPEFSFFNFIQDYLTSAEK